MQFYGFWYLKTGNVVDCEKGEDFKLVSNPNILKDKMRKELEEIEEEAFSSKEWLCKWNWWQLLCHKNCMLLKNKYGNGPFFLGILLGRNKWIGPKQKSSTEMKFDK